MNLTQFFRTTTVTLETQDICILSEWNTVLAIAADAYGNMCCLSWYADTHCELVSELYRKGRWKNTAAGDGLTMRRCPLSMRRLWQSYPMICTLRFCMGASSRQFTVRVGILSHENSTTLTFLLCRTSIPDSTDGVHQPVRINLEWHVNGTLDGLSSFLRFLPKRKT